MIGLGSDKNTKTLFKYVASSLDQICIQDENEDTDDDNEDKKNDKDKDKDKEDDKDKHKKNDKDTEDDDDNDGKWNSAGRSLLPLSSPYVEETNICSKRRSSTSSPTSSSSSTSPSSSFFTFSETPYTYEGVMEFCRKISPPTLGSLCGTNQHPSRCLL